MARKWDIVETHVVEKRKTPDGRKFVNNYEVLQTIGHGRFGKVKLCERIPTPPTASVASVATTTIAAASPAAASLASVAVAATTTTVTTSLEPALALLTTTDDDTATDLLGPPPPPPPPAFIHGASTATSTLPLAKIALPPQPTPQRRQFALKIFSKKALLKIKAYVAESSSDATATSSSNDATATASPSTSKRMRIVTALDHVRDEIAIMRTLYHRNVVLLFEVIESDASDKIYLVLEYMPQGVCMAFDALTQRFTSPLTSDGALTDALAKAHVLDVLSGLAYLHARGVSHRDIKPDNVLLSTTGRCLLSDFGCARIVGGSSAGATIQPIPAQTGQAGQAGQIGQIGQPTPSAASFVRDTVGTFQFLAPECCTGELYDPRVADIWAVGMLLYIFLYRKLPFHATATNELLDEISRWDAATALPSDDERHLTPACRNLLCALLTSDPHARISVADARNHAWFAEEDEEEPLSF